MVIFPTQYSTLAASGLRDHIQKAYGLPDLSCRLLIRNVSDTYILEGGDARYIFKVYRDAHRKLDEIDGEVELLQLLKSGEVPVAWPILDNSGKTIQQFRAAEGIRNGVLFSYAQGKVVLRPNPGQLAIIAGELARMHHLTANHKLRHHRITYDDYTTLERPLKIIRHRFAQMTAEYAFLEKTAAWSVQQLHRLGSSDFGYGYCHYDFLPKNFHFDDDDRVTIFDFDWAGRGFLVNDLMTFYIQLFFLAYVQRITPDQANEDFTIFLEAYRQHRYLAPEEVAAIPALGVMFWIYGFGFYEDNFDDFSNTFLTPKFIKDRVDLIGKWMEMPFPLSLS